MRILLRCDVWFIAAQRDKHRAGTEQSDHPATTTSRIKINKGKIGDDKLNKYYYNYNSQKLE